MIIGVRGLNLKNTLRNLEIVLCCGGNISVSYVSNALRLNVVEINEDRVVFIIF